MTKKFQSLKGKFLIDNGSLVGSFFERTVVLVCEHNTKGAFGLTLNKPVETTVGSALAAQLNEEIKNSPLHAGGPVQPNALSYIYTQNHMENPNVTESLSLGHSLDELEEMAQSFTQGMRIKIFAGYSGWTGGQLEDEIKRGSWIVQTASTEETFNPDCDSLWHSLLEKMGWKYKLIADYPETPGLN